MKRCLNDEQIKEAYKLYVEQNLSTNKISEIYSCSSATIQRGFKKAKLNVRDNSHCKQKYFINENILDIIDTEEKAYWLGFLYADGSVSKTNRVRLNLAEEDKEILEKFSLFFYNEVKIKYYKLPENKKGQNMFYVDICNKHLVNKLNELGCAPNKTFILTYPYWIDSKLERHFIRGYFDGDGCICSTIVKNTKYEKYMFSILSTKELLKSLQVLFKNLNINSSMNKRHKDRDNNNFTLNISGNRQIQRLMDYLYKDAKIFLKRKYIKYQELLENNKIIDERFLNEMFKM